MKGTMVRAGAGQPIKVISISKGIARCLWINGDGYLKQLFYPLEQLTPVWRSLQPRSYWPEITHVDRIASEREERAEDSRKAEKKATRKSKRSNKIKRKSLVPA